MLHLLPNASMTTFTFNDAVQAAKTSPSDIDAITRKLFASLTTDEKLELLDGDDDYWPGLHNMLTDGYNRRPIVHGAVDRLAIPGIRFADGPRGCVVGESTAFPVPMARGATWDVDLEERIGVAIGKEGRAQGANFFGGVCVNLPRHPAWGRIQETYSENPILLGEFGAALTRGVQQNMMACVKHYALNSMENARFQVDVDIDLDVLHEVYLPHFRRIIEEGVASVMSSYNSVRGEWAGQNKELLLDILRDQWGFKGYVISDFLFGQRDGPLSLKNGLDIEAPFRNMRGRTLPQALKEGTVSEADVKRAGLVILRGQLEHALRREDKEPDAKDVVFCDEHRELAKEAAEKSMVLLKNDKVNGEPLLPLRNVSKVAVIGRLANSQNTGDRGSSAVRCPKVVSPYEGLRDRLTGTEVVLDDSAEIESSRNAASGADVAVVIVGYDWRQEGEHCVPAFNANTGLKDVLPPLDGTEVAQFTHRLLVDEVAPESLLEGDDNYGLGAGGDRSSLRLNERDVEIIREVTKANPWTVVAIVAAGAVIMSDWDHLPPAILYSWYSGCEGGHALADILLGRANPSGHLPFSIPRDEKYLPFFDKDATKITYDRWFGQHLLDRQAVNAAYPLGFGLSYTEFAVSGLEVSKSETDPDSLDVKVAVRNTGQVAGRYIAQVYGAANVPDRPRRVLLGFKPIELEARAEAAIEITASTRPLQKWDDGTWSLWTRHVEIEVGNYSGSEASVKKRIQL
ncbi:glycoside hydrolase superfamily [Emericellopsis atlantica]|uniref:beta-glucosidase n=1 Tax=Emericellopsis atlantica TaxID=2614577 RepID=A0A9P7ZS15_9HYPO|nr:glycoside hydrolase superfamily [Emericellopsis atlantica]KAG9256761.1 glycoside hydrolase superfamily [Emericellopsis atlantica]